MGDYKPALWEKITAATVAVAVVGVILYVTVADKDIPARNFCCCASC